MRKLIESTFVTLDGAISGPHVRPGWSSSARPTRASSRFGLATTGFDSGITALRLVPHAEG